GPLDTSNCDQSMRLFEPAVACGDASQLTHGQGRPDRERDCQRDRPCNELATCSRSTRKPQIVEDPIWKLCLIEPTRIAELSRGQQLVAAPAEPLPFEHRTLDP